MAKGVGLVLVIGWVFVAREGRVGAGPTNFCGKGGWDGDCDRWAARSWPVQLPAGLPRVGRYWAGGVAVGGVSGLWL